MFEIVKVAVSIVSFIFVFKTISKSCNKYLAFVIFALWLRFFLSAFHTITFPPFVAGFSINALASIAVAAFGVFLIPTRFFALKKLLILYLFIFTIIISAFYNAEFIGLTKVLVKWSYFLTLAIAIYLSVKLTGTSETLRKLLVAFIMPVSLQLLSLLLGEVKASEADGSVSYIGGYNHEAAFSMVLVSFVIVMGLLPKNTVKLQSFLFVVGIFFIYLANYRTSILAVLPVILIYSYSSLETKIEQRFRLPVMFTCTIFIFFGITVFFSGQQERFQDIGVVLNNLEELIKAPVYFSDTEQKLFSSRVYIWSQYLNAFFSSSNWQQMLGFGPESWSGVFRLYAHNTYVSYLYEFGYFGFSCFILLNLYFLNLAWRMSDKQLSKGVFFSLVGFLIMNLATMPIWAIEGLIVYAILFGIAIANSDVKDKLS